MKVVLWENESAWAAVRVGTLKRLNRPSNMQIMKIGLVIYGSLDTVSGGYLYDRKLVEYLARPGRYSGDHLPAVEELRVAFDGQLPLPPPRGLDTLIIEDELNHPSLLFANRRQHPYPVISLVHHLRCSELRPKWQNDLYRVVEKKYLQSVDGFIFNSKTTESVVNGIIENSKPSIVAYPPTDRFGDAISESEVKGKSKRRASCGFCFLAM